MRIIIGSISTRVLLSAVALTGATLLVAVGCGGGSSSSGSSGGSGGSTDTGGDTSTGGDTTTGGTKNTAGTTSTGGTGGDVSTGGEGGEAGEATVLPPAKNHSAVALVSGGAISTSTHIVNGETKLRFTLIGAVGEAQGGTVSGKQSKSLKHTFIPGVVAAASP